MAIFGFKKRRDEKSDQRAADAKAIVPVGKSGLVKLEKTKRPATGAKALVTMPSAKSGKTAARSKASASVLGAVPSASAQVMTAIIRPHITEKSGILSQNGVYTFLVTKEANKPLVSEAVRNLYKVRPVRVAIVNIPAKSVFVRGKAGRVPGFKKAIVTLRKGEKIEFI